MRVLFMVLVSCLISTFTVSAQDIHFSHIHASPLYLNPSFTGLINDGAARLIVNSKSQWNTVTNAYSTAAASADIKLMANKGTLIAGGMQIFADKAGDLALTTVKTALSASIIKSLDFDDNYLLNFGVNAGHVTNRIDYSQRIGFDDEPLIAQGIDNKINYWDFGVGLSWFARLSEHSQVYVGGSFWHFNTPDVSFSQNITSSSSSTDENDLQREKLYAKKIIHGGGSFKVGQRVWLEPSFIFMDQGPHQEINTGTFVKYLKSKKKPKTYSFYLGAWLRWYLESDVKGVDAAVAAVRMDYNNTYFTLSYDINLSTFQRASNGAGGVELSLIHILALDRYSRRLSPVCCPKI